MVSCNQIAYYSKIDIQKNSWNSTNRKVKILVINFFGQCFHLMLIMQFRIYRPIYIYYHRPIKLKNCNNFQICAPYLYVCVASLIIISQHAYEHKILKTNVAIIKKIIILHSVCSNWIGIYKAFSSRLWMANMQLKWQSSSITRCLCCCVVHRVVMGTMMAFSFEHKNAWKSV